VTTVGSAKGTEVTAREAEILALVARHLTNAQIADALFISPRTVESHVSAMLRKLQLPDRRSLARHAEAMPGVLVRSGHRGLPLPVTPFIGRTGERAALIAALAGHRLVTATGPGGIGKTRLALSVAAEVAPARREGVWFLDLVHVTDPAAVTAAVAETVGVPEQRTTSIDRALVAVLAGSDALLVLDNCEHVLDGVRPCVERIIAGCPEVTVLATSRTRLLLPYERVYVVPGLSVDGGGGDAVDLFTARVAAVTGDPAPLDAGRVAPLCRALDGMALAIELAAARFPALGLDGLESGLGNRLRLLSAGTRVADRHGSLRDAVGWSYDLLSPADRALLRRVSVFASWFDAGAARAVAGGDRELVDVVDGLARLAEHSLLVVERGEPTRYRALETIRQYGVERLDQDGELERIRDAHEQWCRTAVAALRGRGAAGLDEGGLDGSSTTPTRRSPGRRAGSWPPSSPVCSSSAAGRRRPSAGTSGPPSSPRRSPSERATCGSPRARPRAVSPATTPCGCCGRRPMPPSRWATGPVPRGIWRRWRRTSTARPASWPPRTPRRRPTCCSPRRAPCPTTHRPPGRPWRWRPGGAT
jgi:predicted ATPase/DNA-binding CsgD family transcriptional regulator